MNPLPMNQRVMTWLSMCLADESTSKKERMCHAAFTLIVGIVVFICLVASIAFFVKYVTVDIEACLYSVFQFSAESSVLNLIIVGLISQHRIANIFTELAKLYNANKTKSSFQFLIEANNKSEWVLLIYLKYFLAVFVGNMSFSSVASIIYCHYKYHVFDVAHLYKPYKLLLPWNQYTPYGYFGEILLSILHAVGYLVCNGIILILFTSMCWHHQAFFNMFRHTTLKLNQSKNESNANQILGEILRFHISVKDWFLESAAVYSSFVLIQLICNVMFMASVIFELGLRMNRIDFEFVLLLFAFLIGSSNLYVYCFFGQLATESYEQMSECLYESNWHQLSLDLQKKSLLLIMNMQQPVVYHGFGVAVLNLQTFIKVIRSIATYYMMFKTLTH